MLTSINTKHLQLQLSDHFLASEGQRYLNIADDIKICATLKFFHSLKSSIILTIQDGRIYHQDQDQD